ncbi:tRNA uridine-5-carboxymethylaminomethyl(34) synthesis GTPase MnmE [Anaerolineales bacterium HSG25]|nr:tRNA uridine-5-carboxymethylaminomethyl(34) synthesis GTPase MnmE [Anaerolineales bacterium HSG25]
MYSLDDTISAIATSIGKSGVGIIKLSGPKAYTITQQIFEPYKNINLFKPYHLHYGKIHDPESNDFIDEALVVYMPKPHSYTCQDVIEIQAHGSPVVLQTILALTLQLGARLAEAGEMTLRAFLNGRLDLTQAEAVIDVIDAKTEASLRVATKQLEGGLSKQVGDIRQNLVDILAFLEASIDFVEDEIPHQDIILPLIKIKVDLENLLSTADHGLIYRQGVHIAIVGRPNVGKSSLLNTLLRGNRAIVSSIPGTTRDTIEETVNIEGIPIVLVDTAGIRTKTTNEVERIGIERSQKALEQADIALIVIDGSQKLCDTDWAIAKLIRNKPSLLVINKTDLLSNDKFNVDSHFLPDIPNIYISALKNNGILKLEKEITQLIIEDSITTSDIPLVSNPRHKNLLQQTIHAIEMAIIAQRQNIPSDLVSIDIRMAVNSLGEITGETITEGLLDTIFSKFCIGK